MKWNAATLPAFKIKNKSVTEVVPYCSEHGRSILEVPSFLVVTLTVVIMITIMKSDDRVMSAQVRMIIHCLDICKNDIYLFN